VGDLSLHEKVRRSKHLSSFELIFFTFNLMSWQSSLCRSQSRLQCAWQQYLPSPHLGHFFRAVMFLSAALALHGG
jgi:hypothetical protein